MISRLILIAILVCLISIMNDINKNINNCLNSVVEIETTIKYIKEDTNKPVKVEVTAYPPLEKCTDSTPWITASNKRVKHGYIAVSQDIERDFNLKFGDKIYIAGIGEFEFQDRMNPRIIRGIDIWMPSLQECRKFGKKISYILPIKEDMGYM